MSKLTLDESGEPVGYRFYVQPDLYCSYCTELIEPEHQGQGPCHLCGEWRFLYEKVDDRTNRLYYKGA